MKKLLLLLLSALIVPAPALAHSGPPVPSTEWDETTRLTLARAMVGEADWHEADHIAIAFVLAKRWRTYHNAGGTLPFRRYIERYSAALRRDTPRSAWIRAMPWGPLPGPYGDHWLRVQRLVQGWGNGVVKDPCPRAVHWGGPMDKPSCKMFPVDCGLTRNIFYTTRMPASTASIQN